VFSANIILVNRSAVVEARPEIGSIYNTLEKFGYINTTHAHYLVCQKEKYKKKYRGTSFLIANGGKLLT
jgi:hypothetical protein